MSASKIETLVRPTQHVEKYLVTALLDGTYAPGAALPSERSLANEIGVTRPTLRETLQRLANEGWITIHQGRSTVVNDFRREGGLSLLSTMAKYGEYLSEELIDHLLEVRLILLPAVAKLAVQRNPKPLSEHLAAAEDLTDTPEAFADYDWQLHALMARCSANHIFSLILNDFKSTFYAMALAYFSFEAARDKTLLYFREFSLAIQEGSDSVENVVREAVEKSFFVIREMEFPLHENK
jgi:GntR family negative regulator for fad regulon and positive regulator of fabA